MIGEPVALTIRRNFERPAAQLLRAYRGAPTGFVTDSHNGQGCLDYRIKPIDPSMTVCGPALTCYCSPTDNLAAMAALDFAKKGDVIVIAARNDQTAAVIGDRWAMWAKKVGVAGIVCDGLVRDIVGLLQVGIPVFARGLAPNSGFKHGPGEINTRVSCGGIAVDPGDIVVGDRDGVVVVPRADAGTVAARLAEVRKKEVALDAAVRRASSMQFWNEAETRARGGVRYLD
ncbi:MAG: RraA family protein [Betaproteobacteria bacterium]|nr:RraA family protein [Betaproteobacteria bacterium]